MATATRKNLVIPAGKIFIDPLDANDNYTGEQYVGDTPGATLTVETKTAETFGSDDAVSERIDATPVSVVRDYKFKAIEISDFLASLFFGTDPLDHAQASGSVTGEDVLAVIQGRYYQIGRTALNPAGVRGISALTVTDDATPTPATFTITTDYTVDLDLGRLYIVPGGGIATATNLKLAYTKAANSRMQHTSSTHLALALRCGIRFVANHTRGDNQDIWLPNCTLMADGDYQVKRAGQDGKVVEMGFKAQAYKDLCLSSVYIDGRAVA